MYVKDHMTKEPLTITRDTVISKALALAWMKHRGSGLYCVLFLLFMLGLPLRAAVPLLMFEWSWTAAVRR